jgi:hypothetical protein
VETSISPSLSLSFFVHRPLSLSLVFVKPRAGDYTVYRLLMELAGRPSWWVGPGCAGSVEVKPVQASDCICDALPDPSHAEQLRRGMT